MRGHGPNFPFAPAATAARSVSPSTLGPLAGRSPGLCPGVTSCLFGLVLGFGHDFPHATFCLFIDSARSIGGPSNRLGHFRSMFFFNGIKCLCGFLFNLTELPFGNEVGFSGHAISFDSEFTQGRRGTNFCQEIDLQFGIDIGIKNRLGECVEFINGWVFNKRLNGFGRRCSGEHFRQSTRK